MDLTKLIRPRSLAIVGASDREGSIGNKVAKSSQLGSIADRVYFVNPKKDEILGKKCYHKISDLPEVVDSIIICTPKGACPGLVEEAGQFGVGAAIVYAGGFSEEGTEEGLALEKQLIANARKYDMAVLGPNCNGITNNVDKIYMAMLGYTIERERETGIGVISQSGYVTSQCVRPDYMTISYGVSVGNNNIINIEDVMEYMIEDDEVNVLAVYLEGVRNGTKFINLLKRAQEVEKPVVILKTGRSALGAKAAASHTGSMAGSFARYKALFEKYNVVLTDTMQEFVYTAAAFNILKKNRIMPKSGRLACITLSGAENVLSADLCERCGVILAKYTEDTIPKMQAQLPQFATANNPLDATTYYLERTPEFTELINTVAQDPNVDMIGVNVEVTEKPDVKNMSEVYAIIEARKQTNKPIFAMSTMEATRNREVRHMLESCGSPILGPGITGYEILANISKYAAYDASAFCLDSCGAPTVKNDVTAALSENESKALLKENGISVPWEEVVACKADLQKVVSDDKYPLAMKIASKDITHKSDAGGVKLNVKDLAEAEKAFDEILESCKKYKPDAVIDGVLVTGMLPKNGLEMIVGISNDSALGPYVLLGLGGVFTEIFKDTVIAPAPVSKIEAANMIGRLKSAVLLRAYRNGPVYDEDSLADLIVKVSEFAAANKDVIHELDINPVIIYPEGGGVQIADALAIVNV